MDILVKAVRFGDLSEGQVFIHKTVRYIKVEGECGLYNAVRFHDSSRACKLGDDDIVNIEIDLTPDDSDLENTEHKSVTSVATTRASK